MTDQALSCSMPSVWTGGLWPSTLGQRLRAQSRAGSHRFIKLLLKVRFYHEMRKGMSSLHRLA